MTWVTTKLFLRKSWTWFKHYWYVPVLVVYTIVVYVLSRKNTGTLKDVFETRKDSYEEQIKVLNDSHKKELEKKEELIRQYHDTIERLDHEYKKQKLELRDWEREKVKKIVEETHNDPKARVKRISEEFGFELVEILEEENEKNTAFIIKY